MIHESWKPAAPKEAAIEEVRYATMKRLQRLERHPELQALRQQERLEATLLGTLMGLIQTSYLEVQPTSHDTVIRYIVDHAPEAQKRALALIEEFDLLHGKGCEMVDADAEGEEPVSIQPK